MINVIMICIITYVCKNKKYIFKLLIRLCKTMGVNQRQIQKYFKALGILNRNYNYITIF